MAATFTAVMDAAQVEREYRRMQRENVRLTERMQRMTAASGRQQAAMRRQRSTMGQLGTSVAGVMTSYLSLQGVLAGVRNALAFVRGETDRAVASSEQLIESNRQLRQVAISDKDLQAMHDKADLLATEYGETRQTTRAIVFQGRSLGFEEAVPSLIKYGDVVSPEQAALVAGKVPKLFPGSGLTPMQAVDLVGFAAQKSEISFEDMALPLARLAEGGGLTGATPEETAAIMSVMVTSFASKETAADRMKALAVKLSQSEEFGGKGVVEGFKALVAADEEARSDFLGKNAELIVAFGKMKERVPEVDEALGKMEAHTASMKGGRLPFLEQAYEATFSEKTEVGRLNRSLERLRKARISDELKNEKQLAKRGADQEAALLEEMAMLKGGDESMIVQFGATSVGAALKGLNASPEIIAAGTRAGGRATEMTGHAGEIAGLATPAGAIGHVGTSLWGLFGGQKAEPPGETNELLREQLEETRQIRANTDNTTPSVGATVAAGASLATAMKQPR